MRKYVTKRSFAKLFYIIMVFIFLFCLTSCGKTKYIDFDDLRPLDGVMMLSEKSTYATDVEEIKVTWVNNSSKALTFGESFYLVKNVNKKWKKLTIPSNIDFNDGGYDIQPYSELDHIYKLHYIYSNLKAGTYRIVTHYFDIADIPVISDDAYYTYAEFTLTNDEGLLEESKGHFFRTDFGGALVNFPSDSYSKDPSGAEYDSSIVVIETTEQVQAMFGQTYSQIWSNEVQSWVRDEKFTNLINQYDEKFFENNQLVTFVVSASGGAYYFTFSKATYANGKLTIEISQQSSGIGHEAIVSWIALIEVEKVPADTQIDFIVQNRGW